MMQIWNTNGQKLLPEVLEFTVSDDASLDQNVFFPYDLAASHAHAKMLCKQGVLTKSELKKIEQGFAELRKKWELGEVKISQEQEDCHTYIEQYLTKHFGDIGEKIHTWRSRNDQSLTMIRLYELDQVRHIKSLMKKLAAAWSVFAKSHSKITMPGYTHMQRAMPTTVSVWMDSYISALQDALPLVDATIKLLNQSPLGSGAGFGIPASIDRDFTARELGFSQVQKNPIYCQFSRGWFESQTLHVAGMVMTVLSRWASDLLLFTTKEFGFFSLPPELVTGSSIMPQKKNYDVLELLRAKSATVAAAKHEIELLIQKLPSGYHRDLQLIKPPLVRGLNVTAVSLNIAALVAKYLKVHSETLQKAMTPEIYATARVYEQVKRGVSFRKAYRTVKSIRGTLGEISGNA